MSLILMFITNKPDFMILAEKCGVNRIFIDMETIGKEKRQPKMDTVKSFHTVDDVKNARKVLNKAEILVRINSIWEGSEEEINNVIEAGADVVMLPYFKSKNEVELFLKYVDRRAKTCLLFETDSSVLNVDDILSLDGIDEAYVGINDMHLCYKKSFMFEMLSDGTVEYLCNKFKEKNIPFGFGGIARLGYGDVPAEMVLGEHYRLGSTIVILSRSFCRINDNSIVSDLEEMFKKEIANIREYENSLTNKNKEFFIENQKELYGKIEIIAKNGKTTSM
ncbi:MAG: aldolase [Clostridia bacterium]|nr:aldolase [Clostridia bacterium]